MNKTMSNLQVPTPKGTPLNKDISSSLSQRDILGNIRKPPNTTKTKYLDENKERITFYAPKGQKHQLPALVGDFREVISPINYTTSDEFPNYAEQIALKRNYKDFKNAQSLDPLNYMPRASMASKIKVWEKINELKNSLTKYMSVSDEVIHPTKGDIKKIINCIQLLNENQEDNSLSELLEIIVKLLKMSIFVNPKLIKANKDILLSSQHPDLEKIVEFCPEETVPYYSLVSVFIKYMANKDEGKEKMIAAPLEAKILELQQLLEHKDADYQQLKGKFAQIISRDEYEFKLYEIEELQKKVEILVDSNKGLSENLKFLREESNFMADQQKREMDAKNEELKTVELLSFQKQVAEDEVKLYKTKMRQAKNNMNAFKDTLDKILIKLKVLRSEIEELRQKNEEIVFENERLTTRAAVGFENLTPRPNFKKLATEYEFELILVDEKKKPTSTVNIAGSMAKKIKDLNQKIIDITTEANKPKFDMKKSYMKKSTSEMKNSTRNNLANRQKNLKASDDSADPIQPSFEDLQSPVQVLERKESKLRVDVPRLTVENSFGTELLNKTKDLANEIKKVKYSLDHIPSDGEDN